MKLSDYVFSFFVNKGINNVFLLPGGGCMHLADSAGHTDGLNYYVCLHEQAAAVAAEAYAQHTNGIGLVLVTSGPGGTNAITGVAAAWLDSTPLFVISGQVKRDDLIKDSGVRQMGAQELPIVPVVSSITKYAKVVMNPEDIRYELEKAYYTALSGRRGPVWLDIPLDVSAAEIDIDSLTGYTPPEPKKIDWAENAAGAFDLLAGSKRPLILCGHGVKLSDSSEIFVRLAEALKIPVVFTWKVLDMMAYDHPLNFGCVGGMGHRYANFILQNCDCLLILGSRLDKSITAFDDKNFAPNAKKIMVDIDENEINKMKFDISLKITGDVNGLLKEMSKTERCFYNSEWVDYCNGMKNKYPVLLAEHINEKEFVNAYAFTDALSNAMEQGDIIVPESAGGAGEITYQGLKIKRGQKIKNCAGLGAMGFGLPYAIGSCIANGFKRTILINGDGAFQLNVQELETAVRLRLPIKMFILNNGGYLSITNTQKNFFGQDRLVGSNENSGLTLPDVKKQAAVYGIPTFQIRNNGELSSVIGKALKTDGAVLVEVMINPEYINTLRVLSKKLPDGSMASGKLEDMFPYLPEDEFRGNMLE